MITLLMFLLFGLIILLGIHLTERYLIDDDME
jgi:hypothetical protein